jgi:hypothetical protein
MGISHSAPAVADILSSRLFHAGLPATGALPVYLFSVFSIIFLQILINHLFIEIVFGRKVTTKNHFP